MEDNEVDEKKTISSPKDLNVESINCSKCKKTISSGQYYVRSILTGEITCSDCDDNRILIKGENFYSID